MRTHLTIIPHPVLFSINQKPINETNSAGQVEKYSPPGETNVGGPSKRKKCARKRVTCESIAVIVKKPIRIK